MKQMLQALLADRFHLTFHREQKEMKALVLTVASSGSKLKPAAEPDAKGLDHAWFEHDASQALKDSPTHAIYAASFQKTGLRAVDFGSHRRHELFYSGESRRTFRRGDSATAA